MPLTYGQIRTRYEDITGTTVVKSTLANMIDDAQVEIAKRYGKIVTEDYTADAGEEYDLPSDHLQTEEIRDENNRVTYDYQITPDDMIIFASAGDYVMKYTKVPDPIDSEDEDSVPEVHPLFHGMIVQYCLSKYWEERSEGIPAEEAKAERLIREFYRKVDEAALVLRRRSYVHEYLDVHPIAKEG